MIKGCRKRMIIVSGLNDSSIEAAYFVMRDNENADTVTDDDILKKANSIIENSVMNTVEFGVSDDNNKEKKEKNKIKKAFISFIFGFISGGAMIGIFSFIFDIL